MALFRDLDGNFFRIPAEVLETYRVEGELPEGSALDGQEAEAVLTAGATAPSYVWPSAADVIPTPAPSYVWPSAATH